MSDNARDAHRPSVSILGCIFNHEGILSEPGYLRPLLLGPLFAPHRPNGIRALDWLVGKSMPGERSGGKPPHNTCLLSSEMQYKIKVPISVDVGRTEAACKKGSRHSQQSCVAEAVEAQCART